MPSKIPKYGPEAESGQNSVLAQLMDRKGVRKDDAGKVSPTLTTNETSRYKKIFSIMKDVIDPGPEAERISKTKAAKNLPNVSQVGAAKTPGSKGGFNWKTLLYGLGAALIAGIVAITDEVGAFLIKTGLKMQRLLKPVMKFFNYTGKLLTKGFGKALKYVEPLMKIVGKVGDWFGNIFKGLKANKTMGKMFKGAKNAWTIIKGAGGKIVEKLLKLGRFIPFVGSLFSFGYAIKKFGSGDYIGATLELLSGVLNLIPGGALPSMLIDGYIMFRDWDKSKEKKEDDKLKGPSKMEGIMTKVKEWFSEHATKLPIISGIMQMGKAAKLLGDKKWVEGIKALALVMPYWLVGEGGVEAISYGANFIMDLFRAEPEDHTADQDDGSDFGDIMSGLYDAVTDVLSKLWSGITGFIGEWVNNVIINVKETAISGLKVFARTAGKLIGWDPGEFVDNIFSDASATSKAATESPTAAKVSGTKNAELSAWLKLDQERNRYLESMRADLRTIREFMLTPKGNLEMTGENPLTAEFYGTGHYAGRGQMGPPAR